MNTGTPQIDMRPHISKVFDNSLHHDFKLVKIDHSIISIAVSVENLEHSFTLLISSVVLQTQPSHHILQLQGTYESIAVNVEHAESFLQFSPARLLLFQYFILYQGTLVALPVDTEPKRCYYHIDIAMSELCSCFGFRMFSWACAVCVVLVTEKKIQRLEQRNTFVIWTSRLLVNIFAQKHSDKNENNK
uniref:Uncharacterized protein n=1 Tax=Oryza nivara TaxID=4536 RepID=A0A0E0HKT7_ORYNI